MKKTYNTTQTRSVRRWFKRVFASFINRQDFDCRKAIVEMRENLRELSELVDIIAREVARQAKREVGSKQPK